MHDFRTKRRIHHRYRRRRVGSSRPSDLEVPRSQVQLYSQLWGHRSRHRAKEKMGVQQLCGERVNEDGM